MPSKSPQQHRLMEAVANNPEFAKKTGIPEKVGKDFAMADIGRKFGPIIAVKSKKGKGR